jgi:hypothetical protein
MWQFVAHHVMRPALWTWRRLNRNGTVAEQSAVSFNSYRKALHDATRHGFDPEKDAHEKVELKAKVESKASGSDSEALR